MVRLGFSLEKEYDIPLQQVLELLHGNGFSAISPVWSETMDMEKLAFSVQAQHMDLQSMHAPHKHIDYLWQPESPEAIAATENILRCLEDCAHFQVPVMVMHCWKGVDYTFPDTPLDYRCFDTITEYASKLGVVVAFENLEGEEYLAALLERYQTLPQVGFCWDSGHDSCYLHKTDFLQCYGQRLVMTHMNDNLGIRDPGGMPCGLDDLHFLPFDGSVDWVYAMSRLAAAAPQETLNFELKKVSKSKAPEDLLYNRLSTEAYLLQAATQAKKVAALYEASLQNNGHIFTTP